MGCLFKLYSIRINQSDVIINIEYHNRMDQSYNLQFSLFIVHCIAFGLQDSNSNIHLFIILVI